MKRLFVAIRIVPNEHFLKLYDDLQNLLRRESIRWVEPQNLHLTLKFFGETPHDKIDIISSGLKDIAVNFSPFSFILKNIGIFGSSYKPRIIWFGTEKDKQILFLTNKILGKADCIGLLRDRQNHVPHLTLGRMRKIKYNKAFQQAVASFGEVFVQEINVSEFVLFESELYPGGPVYTLVEKYKLK